MKMPISYLQVAAACQNPFISYFSAAINVIPTLITHVHQVCHEPHDLFVKAVSLASHSSTSARGENFVAIFKLFLMRKLKMHIITCNHVDLIERHTEIQNCVCRSSLAASLLCLMWKNST